MGGRPAKPIQLHLANGNRRHLTKEEIVARQQQESALKSSQRAYKPNAHVRADKVALKMFRQLQKLYKEIEYVEGLDENVINRYCLLHSELSSLRDLRQKLEEQMDQKQADDDDAGMVALMDRILDIDHRQHKKMEMLLKLEDRLFLNPTSRIKNVPKAKEQAPQQTPFQSVFGNV